MSSIEEINLIRTLLKFILHVVQDELFGQENILVLAGYHFLLVGFVNIFLIEAFHVV